MASPEICENRDFHTPTVRRRVVLAGTGLAEYNPFFAVELNVWAESSSPFFLLALLFSR
jgi:hypothetical protein